MSSARSETVLIILFTLLQQSLAASSSQFHKLQPQYSLWRLTQQDLYISLFPLEVKTIIKSGAVWIKLRRHFTQINIQVQIIFFCKQLVKSHLPIWLWINQDLDVSWKSTFYAALIKLTKVNKLLGYQFFSCTLPLCHFVSKFIWL